MCVWFVCLLDVYGVSSSHRYLKKSRLLKFLMCLLLALPFLRAFLWWPLTLLTRQTRQAVCAINQSVFLRCLWQFKISVDFWSASCKLIKLFFHLSLSVLAYKLEGLSIEDRSAQSNIWEECLSQWDFPFKIGSCPCPHKCQTRLEWLARDKHSSLFVTLEKMFYWIGDRQIFYLPLLHLRLI